ncbi:MAG: GDP-mannose 4,6-dehydratase [Bacilli bacterium]|nr:GDP-mannose 4,6-dehydratase [Bacilli bacterium]
MAVKAYVTGAGGMIGSHLVEMLAKRGYEVVGSYYTPTVDLKDIDKTGVRLFELDVRNHETMKDWICNFLPDKIFHLAAQSFPVVSWNEPYYTFDVNANGTVGLLEAVKEAKKRNPGYDPMVVVISSSAIYGEALLSYDVNNLPKEDCALLPLHPYGVSKVAEDLLCFQYYRNFGIRTARVRLFNCTGPRKVGDITADFTKRAVELKKRGDNKLVVGNLTALRAIIDARDVCEALIVLSEKGAPGEAYNLCSSHIFKMTHVVECIEQIMGVKYELVTDQKLLRPADERLYAGNCDKLKSLGWEEKYQYIDTVRDMIDYWEKKLG